MNGGLLRKSASLWTPLLATSIAASWMRVALPSLGVDISTQLLQAVQILALLGAAMAAWANARDAPAPRALFLRASLAFGILTTVSLLWSISRGVTALDTFAWWVLLTFLLSTVKWRWRKRQRVLADLHLIYWMVLAVSSVGLFLFYCGLEGAEGQSNRLQGILGNPNWASMAIVFIWPLGLYVLGDPRASASKRWVYGVSSMLLILVVVLTGSRASLAAAVLAAFLIVGLDWRRWPGVLLAITFVVVSVLAAPVLIELRELLGKPNPVSTTSLQQEHGMQSAAPDRLFAGRDRDSRSDLSSGRIETWRFFVGEVNKRPFTGSGFGTAQILGAPHALSTHNIFLLVWVELGLLGLALFSLAVTTLARAGRARGNIALAACGLSIMVVELFDSSLLSFGAPTTTIAWMVLMAWATLGTLRGSAVETNQGGAANLTRRANQSWKAHE